MRAHTIVIGHFRQQISYQQAGGGVHRTVGIATDIHTARIQDIGHHHIHDTRTNAPPRTKRLQTHTNLRASHVAQVERLHRRHRRVKGRTRAEALPRCPVVGRDGYRDFVAEIAIAAAAENAGLEG